MSGGKTLVTEADLHEIETLAEALQEIVDDKTIPLYAADFLPESDEFLVRFRVDLREHEAWMTTRFLKSVGMYERLLTA